MTSIPIFDLHADVFMDLVRKDEAADADLEPSLETDHIARMRSGGILGAVLTDCRMAGEVSEPAHLKRFIMRVGKEIAAHKAAVVQVLGYGDLLQAQACGKFAAIIGYEGLSAARGDIEWIERLYQDAGLRVAALSHNDDNLFCGGALGDYGGRHDDTALGLTEKGREAVARMNKLGIVIDMAHAGKKAVKDILAASMKPVMLSHTSSKKVYDNGRNLSDEEIKEIADHGGLVGCMTSPAALAPLHERREHTLDRFILHLTGMINAGGIDHAGLGLHFCEYLYTPDRYPPVRDLENASKAGGIIGKLEEAGFSPEAVEKIAWKNFFRLFKDVTGSPPAGPEGRSAVY